MTREVKKDLQDHISYDQRFRRCIMYKSAIFAIVFVSEYPTTIQYVLDFARASKKLISINSNWKIDFILFSSHECPRKARSRSSAVYR